VVEILKIAREYGFRCFIDPHQDVWSRFTGGSGAPLWTLEKVGFIPENLSTCHAAIVQNTFSNPAEYPKMIWPTNYYKLACATMFTLFFAGNVFAPKLLVDNEPIQEYLQRHYMNSVCEMAKAIIENNLQDVVIGYDTLNEPGHGWIGVEDITQICKEQELRKGFTPTPFQTMMLGMGYPQTVEYWDMTSVGPQKMSDQYVDPKGTKAWNFCVWADHQVWDPKTKSVRQPHYFQYHPITGVRVDFLVDFWKPFVNLYSTKIRHVHQNAIMFIEPPVNAIPPVWDHFDTKGPICYAPHWYDGITLINKQWNSWYTVDYIGFLRGRYSSIAFALKFGEKAIKNCFKSQLRTLRLEGEEYIGQ
jgi:hypothetical protein